MLLFTGKLKREAPTKISGRESSCTELEQGKTCLMPRSSKSHPKTRIISIYWGDYFKKPGVGKVRQEGKTAGGRGFWHQVAAKATQSRPPCHGPPVEPLVPCHVDHRKFPVSITGRNSCMRAVPRAASRQSARLLWPRYLGTDILSCSSVLISLLHKMSTTETSVLSSKISPQTGVLHIPPGAIRWWEPGLAS